VNMNVIVLVACGVAALVSLISAVVGVSITRSFKKTLRNDTAPTQRQGVVLAPVEHGEKGVLSNIR
jgi:hypothetical protein